MADDTPWGLFHKHTVDGRLSPFSYPTAMSRSSAESEAEGIRVGRGRGGATDQWTVVALPIGTATESITEAGLNHAEHALKHKPSGGCSGWSMAFGGRCFNCGFVPKDYREVK